MVMVVVVAIVVEADVELLLGCVAISSHYP